MPCLSDGYDERDERDYYDSQREQLKRDKAQLEAALCTALTFIENAGRIGDYVTETDWKEAGITPEQVRTWWEDHKEKDRIRREKEQAKFDAAEARQAAIDLKVKNIQRKSWAELTKAEIKFLTTHAKK